MTTSELIEQTKQLIAIPSTAANPEALKQAVNFIEQIVRAAHPDITIEKFERNDKPSFLAYKGTVRPEKFDVLLNAHLDVVPGTPEQFIPYEKDGKLYGRGVLDMKGTAVVLTDVFCELVKDVPYALGLQIVSDEELGGYNGVKLHVSEGVRTEFAIMGEYANDRHTIYNAARGICWTEIAFKGKTAHGGHLWNGNNAVLMASDFAGAVLRRYPTPDKETWTTTASIANISTSNQTYNRVPDEAILKIDFRFTQEDPVFATRENLEAFIHSINPEAELINLATFEPAVHAEELNPYVQGLSAALTKVTGKKAQYLGRPASSDGRHFALVGNDLIEYGIYGQGPHSDLEYAEIASFAEYRSVMQAFLQAPQVHAHLPKATVPKEPLKLKILRDLVAMQTVTGDFDASAKALDYIESFLEKRGMHTRRYEQNGFPSLVATVRPNHKTPTVMLTGHIDVVPASDHMFTLVDVDGNYHGRGVYDMKFAIASYLGLIDDLQDNLNDYDLGIIITSDEEVGGQDGMKMLVDKGYHPKIAIVPDGGDNWQIQELTKGVHWLKLTSTGIPGHASQPWKTDNAIHNLLLALAKIQALVHTQPSEADPFRTSLSIGTINGGEAANQAAALATAVLDIRYGNSEDYLTMYPAIQNIAASYGITVEAQVSDPPLRQPLNDPYVRKFKDTIIKHIGTDPGLSLRFATTDARFFNRIGIPAIIVSPVGGDCHSEQEWLSAKSYEQFCNILKDYVHATAHTDAVNVKPSPIKTTADQKQ